MFQYSDTLGSDILFQTWIFLMQIIMRLSYSYKYCFKSHVSNSVVTASLVCVLITYIFIKFFLSHHFLGIIQKLFPSCFLHMWNNCPKDLGKTSITFGKPTKIQQSFTFWLKDKTKQIFNNTIKKKILKNYSMYSLPAVQWKLLTLLGYILHRIVLNVQNETHLYVWFCVASGKNTGSAFIA